MQSPASVHVAKDEAANSELNCLPFPVLERLQQIEYTGQTNAQIVPAASDSEH